MFDARVVTLMRSKMFLMALAFVGLAISVQAQPLFHDAFTSPIDTAKWDIVNDGAATTEAFFDVQPFDLGGGDYCVQIVGNDSDYDDGLRTKMSFNRGLDLRVDFKMWKGGNVAGDTENDWVYHGIAGPWVNSNVIEDGTGGGPYDVLAKVEAGIARASQALNADAIIDWDENGALWQAIDLDPSFRDAWFAADSKATALIVRVWLGDSTGARGEFSTDGGGTYQPLTIGGNPIDTRGMEAGTDANGLYAGSTNTVSSASEVWVFFGGEFGLVYIDDVYVRNRDNIPVEISNFIID